MTGSQSSVQNGLIAILIIVAFGLASVNQQAQTRFKYPTPTIHISDFANVLDENTRTRLETLLQNFKTQSKIDFFVATVENTDDADIFDFSRQLATQWNIGARTSASKSLLLVIAVNSRTSFTQFSRMVQPELPDGVLGEMAQRMKAAIGTGEFNEALTVGVDVFVKAVGQKLGFNAADLDRPSAVASASPEAQENRSVTVTDRTSIRPRQVTERSNDKIETAQPSEMQPKETSSTATEAASSTTVPKPKNPRTKPTSTATNAVNKKPVAIGPTTKKNAPPVDDEAEAEEVELTLTLPLDKRAVKLKEFLATHPTSKARPRATELLISTHAALGDQKLKNGDRAGIDELMLAVDEADPAISDKLYSGVISQIPMNLYLRSEQPAAFKAAQVIETKFGTDPKRLLLLASFYLGVERGDEAARIAEHVVKTAPDVAEAYRVYALGLHLSLRLDEAAAAYKRFLELDPSASAARNSLADLNRGIGKAEEALALYTEQLKNDPKDKPAATGAVLSLLELGRTDEANTRLDAVLAEDSRNLPLLTGAAYWFAAHEKYDRGFDLARKAVDIEPRYTWAQIALARSLLGLKQPLDAERSLRYARQYGKFPTLNYELASVLGSMGLYDEAVEVLRESFVIADGQIQTRLAGRFPTTNDNFIDLLAPERRASIYQNTAADSAANAKMLKELLVFSNAITPASDSQKIDEAKAVAAAREFASGTD
ncbi:MAG TPA: TPM domain-containing protein, partial [Pyrinomonadaceae bacterium]